MTQHAEWVVTKWDEFGEPLLREPVAPPPETPQPSLERKVSRRTVRTDF